MIAPLSEERITAITARKVAGDVYRPNGGCAQAWKDLDYLLAALASAREEIAQLRATSKRLRMRMVAIRDAAQKPSRCFDLQWQLCCLIDETDALPAPPAEQTEQK